MLFHFSLKYLKSRTCGAKVVGNTFLWAAQELALEYDSDMPSAVNLDEKSG